MGLEIEYGNGIGSFIYNDIYILLNMSVSRHFQIHSRWANGGRASSASASPASSRPPFASLSTSAEKS
jgi:hypothetical protein